MKLRMLQQLMLLTNHMISLLKCLMMQRLHLRKSRRFMMLQQKHTRITRLNMQIRRKQQRMLKMLTKLQRIFMIKQQESMLTGQISMIRRQRILQSIIILQLTLKLNIRMLQKSLVKLRNSLIRLQLQLQRLKPRYQLMAAIRFLQLSMLQKSLIAVYGGNRISSLKKSLRITMFLKYQKEKK